MNIVVLISGNGSTLQALINYASTGNYKIIKVISNNPGSLGISRAHKAQIATSVIDHTLYTNKEHFEEALIEEINQSSPDFILLAGFMRILSPRFVGMFFGQLVNIHPSLLPKYKGLHTHQKALDNNDKQHGTTIHFVTHKLDDGPIITQASLDIHPNETYETLSTRVQQMEAIIYPKITELLTNKRLKLIGDSILFDNITVEKTGIILNEKNLTIL